MSDYLNADGGIAQMPSRARLLAEYFMTVVVDATANLDDLPRVRCRRRPTHRVRNGIAMSYPTADERDTIHWHAVRGATASSMSDTTLLGTISSNYVAEIQSPPGPSGTWPPVIPNDGHARVLTSVTGAGSKLFGTRVFNTSHPTSLDRCTPHTVYFDSLPFAVAASLSDLNLSLSRNCLDSRSRLYGLSHDARSWPVRERS